jgi:hypothetical protein
MRIRWIVTLGLTGILMSACSAASSEQASKNAVGNGNANAVVVANSGVLVPANLPDANIANFSSGERPAPVNSMKRDIIKKGGPPISLEQAREIASKNAKPAPENSTFYTFLADSGYEVRTFKSHPQLLRVEKETTNEGKTTVKVFLRGGKVVDVDGNRVPQLSTMPVQVILDLAGVPRRDPPAVTGPQLEKKPSE